MNDQIIYNVLCGLSNVFAFNPGATLAQSQALYPDIYERANGVGGANGTALIAATVEGAVKPAEFVISPNSVNLSAIAPTYASLPDARSSVDTLRGEVASSLNTIRDCVVAIKDSLILAGYMAAE